MPHRITPDEQYQADEYVRWEFTIQKDGGSKDITGATVRWYLLPRRGAPAADAILDDGDTAITLSIVDAANGRVDVEIDSDTTGDWAGEALWQRLVLTDSGGRKQIWAGDFYINPV